MSSVRLPKSASSPSRTPRGNPLIDVMMPNLDGYEVCRRIKAQERTKDIVVLFLTARYEMQDKIRGLEVGGHDYLTKPVEQPELVARTRSALRVKALHDGSIITSFLLKSRWTVPKLPLARMAWPTKFL